MTNNQLDPWMHFFKTILDMPLGSELTESRGNENEIIKRNKEI